MKIIKTVDYGLTWLYGCRPKSWRADLGCGLGWGGICSVRCYISAEPLPLPLAFSYKPYIYSYILHLFAYSVIYLVTYLISGNRFQSIPRCFFAALNGWNFSVLPITSDRCPSWVHGKAIYVGHWDRRWLDEGPLTPLGTSESGPLAVLLRHTLLRLSQSAPVSRQKQLSLSAIRILTIRGVDKE